MLPRGPLLVVTLSAAFGCARAGAPVAAPMLFVPVESVAPVGIAEAPGAASASSDRAAGQRVEVEWRGRWLPAVIVAPRGAGWLIHYDGYGEDQDEVVGSARIREPSPLPPDRTSDEIIGVEPDP